MLGLPLSCWDKSYPYCYNLPFPCLYHLVSSHLVTLSPHHLVTSSPCHLVTSPPCHLATLSPFHSYHHNTTPPHHLIILYHPDTLSPHHLITISLRHSLPRHHDTLHQGTTTLSTLSPYHPISLLSHPRLVSSSSSLQPRLLSSLYTPEYSLSWTLYLSPLIPVNFYLDPHVLSVSFHLHPCSRSLVSSFVLVSTCSLILDHVLSVFFSHHGHPSLGSLISPYLCFPSCTCTAWSVPISPLVLLPSHL